MIAWPRVSIRSTLKVCGIWLNRQLSVKCGEGVVGGQWFHTPLPSPSSLSSLCHAADCCTVDNVDIATHSSLCVLLCSISALTVSSLNPCRLPLPPSPYSLYCPPSLLNPPLSPFPLSLLSPPSPLFPILSPFSAESSTLPFPSLSPLPSLSPIPYPVPLLC